MEKRDIDTADFCVRAAVFVIIAGLFSLCVFLICKGIYTVASFYIYKADMEECIDLIDDKEYDYDVRIDINDRNSLYILYRIANELDVFARWYEEAYENVTDMIRGMRRNEGVYADAFDLISPDEIPYKHLTEQSYYDIDPLDGMPVSKAVHAYNDAYEYMYEIYDSIYAIHVKLDEFANNECESRKETAHEIMRYMERVDELLYRVNRYIWNVKSALETEFAPG